MVKSNVKNHLHIQLFYQLGPRQEMPSPHNYGTDTSNLSFSSFFLVNEKAMIAAHLYNCNF